MTVATAEPVPVALAAPATGPDADITLKRSERGILLGKTRTGKSTCAGFLIRSFLNEYPASNVFIADTKPRFRATYHPNGLKVRYKDWADGDAIEGSVAVADEDVPLKQAFLHSRVVIFQSRRADRTRVADYRIRLAEYADDLMKLAGKRRPMLFYIDEFYDIVGPTGHADPRILSTIREGGEMDLAVLAGAQRPRAIPLPILTEAANYYIFYLQNTEDIKRISDLGLTRTLWPTGHKFLFHRNLKGSDQVQFLAELKQ